MCYQPIGHQIQGFCHHFTRDPLYECRPISNTKLYTGLFGPKQKVLACYVCPREILLDSGEIILGEISY